MSDANGGDAGTAEARVIGPLGAVAIVAGSMLGIGIFLTPRLVAEQLHTPGLFLLAWALGGLIALAGAVAYAELGTLMPKAGGDYVFVREAFGSSAAFASGWLLFAGVFVGSIASMAVPVFQYQMPVLTGVDFGAIEFAGLPATRWLAMSVIVVLTGVNILGTRLATWVQIALTMIPFALFALGAVVVFAQAPFDGAVASEATTASNGSLPVALTRATLAIYFAYAGWNAVAYVGGEVKNPGRTMPIGLLGGTIAITAFYVLLCGAFVVAHGMGGLLTAFEAGSATAAVLGGDTVTWIVTLLIALALFGSLNGTILAGARIAGAMARDGALVRSLGVIDPRTRTPVRALLLQAVLACALVLTGTFEQLVELTSIAMLVMGGLAVTALFVFRARRPQADRPYRATGYPVLPGFYLLVSVVVVGISVVRVVTNADGAEGLERWLSLLGLAVFGLAWIAHRVVAGGRSSTA